MARKVSVTKTLTIANAAALSDEFKMEGYSEIIIFMPAAWTAAGIGFHVSTVSGGTFVPLFDAAGDEIETAAAVDQAYSITTVSGPYVKLWSQTAGVDVVQGAARTITAVLMS